MIKLLVVDDSAFIRKVLTSLLSDDALIQVVGTARDGIDAVKKARELKPDVITMDVEMPKMDGIKAVKQIMAENPCPILMFSSLTLEGATTTIEALQAGAVDFITKERSFTLDDKEQVAKELAFKIKSIYASRRSIIRNTVASTAATPVGTSPKPVSVLKRPTEVIAIGISTGGPLSLQKILPQIPTEANVPILIVQHMPAEFTPTLANRLNARCKVKVIEAGHGMPLEGGTIYIAPGGKHLLVGKKGSQKSLFIVNDKMGKIHCPSVDLLFESVATHFGSNSLGIVMTGMGNDGLEGSRKIKQSGGMIVAQNAESCVVYGMPKAVVEARVADKQISLDAIGSLLVRAAATPAPSLTS